MSVFIDTGVLYADHDESASRHATAERALEAVYEGEFGHPYTSDYVYDETVTLTLRRTGTPGPAHTIGRRIRGDDPFLSVYSMLFLDSATFDRAVERFEHYDDQRLSFTDATSIALCERESIDRILSFDSDFDGLMERIPPESV